MEETRKTRFDLSDSTVAQFWRDGYVIVRSVFTPATIASAKSALIRQAGITDSGDGLRSRLGSHSLGNQAAAFPAARDLMFSADVISIVEKLLGHRPIYFGDSGVQYGPGYTGWHKDNRLSDRKDGSTPDWQGDYDLIRVGIYLQDCANFSGGLLVRAGSQRNAPHLPAWAREGGDPLRLLTRRIHAFRSRFSGDPRFVDTRTGDIVVWTLRTTHAGHAVRIKGAKELVLDPRVQQIVPKALRIPVDGVRAAIFATFARPGVHYDRYREYIVSRDYFSDRPHVAVADAIPSTVTFDEIQVS